MPAAPSFTEEGDFLMDLIVQVVALATAVVGLAAAIVKAAHESRGSRPETKAGRKR